MSLMAVRSLEPGANTLPAELRVRNFGTLQRSPRATQVLLRLERGQGRLLGGQRLGTAGLLGLGQDTVDVSSAFGFDQTPLPPETPPPDVTPQDFTWMQDLTTQVESAGIPPNLMQYMPTAPPTGWNGPVVVPPTQTPPAPPAGYQWATVLDKSSNALARILAVGQGGSSVQLPNGMQLLYGSPQAAAFGSGAAAFGAGASAFATPLGVGTGTLLLVAGLAVLFMMGSRGR